jgi:putative ABC transport system permease protein
MILPSLVGSAIHALLANSLRTFLTMLGMMIGVAAVILMLAIGEGAKAMVSQAIESMGSNLFIILSGATTSGGARVGAGAKPTLTYDDALAIRQLPLVSGSAPVTPGTSQIVYGNVNWSTSVYGVTPDYPSVRNWQLQSGGFFTDAEVRSAARVAVIGQVVARELFGEEDPIGKIIRIKNSPFQVIGVLSEKGQSLDGRDQDDTAMVPITAAQQKLYGSPFPGSVRFIMVQGESEAAMDAAEESITALLRARHRIGKGEENDFTVRNLAASAQAQAQATNVMSYLLGAIAAVSLLVGGIGIMNIMLVSVTERTREIGIRMAIGARRWDILWQFLIEALTVSVMGCLIGLLLGVGGALLVEKLADLTVVVSASSLLMATGVALAVGLFFGFYPARRAAGLDPIEALRTQ